MCKVTIPKRCDCFNKSGLKTDFEFDSNEEAVKHALKLKNNMNETFCAKHKFEIIKIFDNYVISTIKIKEKSLKCCGSGCCF